MSTYYDFQLPKFCHGRRVTSVLVALAIAASAKNIRAAEAVAGAPLPLERAHAHNDYAHERPLLDALEHGFCSIEADVWASGEELLVAHNLGETRPERTLEAVYLAPLAERVAHRGGWVYDRGRTVTLLIDIKSDGKATYAVLVRQLAKYRDLFTPRDAGDGRSAAAPVLAVISGNRPVDAIAADPHRLCGIDGRLADLDSPQDAALIPLISDAWFAHFTWDGVAKIPDGERQKLRRLAAKTHAAGRRLRFWGAPDTEAVWSELYDAGVDLLNADDLPRLQRFLLSRQGD